MAIDSASLLDSTRKPPARRDYPSKSFFGDFFRFHGSVIPRVTGPTILLTIWSAAVTVVYMYTKIFEGWLSNSPMLITLLGVVLGLLLAFRTNTAYDRYWEGRKLWSTVFTNIRNLTRLFWIGVHAPNAASLTPHEYSEKLGALNLLLAFCTSTKHFLRDEESWTYKDLAPYLQHLPEFSRGVSNPELDRRVIPLEITHHLASYVAACRERNFIDASVQGTMNTAIGALVDSFTQFERIKSSPIPIAYSVHLKQILIIYILSIPFQIVVLLKWTTIPVVFLATFMLLGIESIGYEIEQPFGLDINDLPIDEFCDSIHEEILALTTRTTHLNPGVWLEPYSIAEWPEKYRAKTPSSEVTAHKDDAVVIEMASAEVKKD